MPLSWRDLHLSWIKQSGKGAEGMWSLGKGAEPSVRLPEVHLGGAVTSLPPWSQGRLQQCGEGTTAQQDLFDCLLLTSLGLCKVMGLPLCVHAQASPCSLWTCLAFI